MKLGLKINQKYEWYCSKCGSIELHRMEDDLFGKRIKVKGSKKYFNLK
jgi:hypothetical protein